MIEIFRSAIKAGASDLHMKTGDLFRARINGELVPMTQQRLTQEQIRQVALQLIPHKKDRDHLDDITDYDCSWGAPGIGRFRVNILRQRGSLMIVMRVIPMEIPTFEKLELPSVLAEIAMKERGLVLVTGVTGSGKSTSLASMIGHLNANRRRHVITLENPIEFLHRDNQCSITQREVGTDTLSFESGLRAALREDPDVILIGEMRDTTTIDTALKAVETGHLVLSTLHTQNAVQTISRIVAVFPPHEQAMVRVRLAETLVAVVSQRLLPRLNRAGRIAAVEIMVVTAAIREAMLSPEGSGQIYELIEDGRQQYGSQSFDQHLMELVSREIVAFDVAKAAANNPSDFELKLKTLA
jgi:twitching motility protein PilT